MVIVEKRAKEAGGDASRYVRSLATYMETAKRGTLAEEYGLTLAAYLTADKGGDEKAPGQRVLATGGLVNGRATDWDAALTELNARMNKRSSRSKKPARHVIGSVHEEEVISPEACDDMAAVLADELGCEAGVVLWALHGDTDNPHPHFLILTLNENGAALPFGRDGRSHEAMQRAIARIEHNHGFTREPGARYEMHEGKVERTVQTPRPKEVRTPFKTATLQWEAETGIESFTRYAQGILAPLIDASGSWDEVQTALAPHGARIMKAGSGGKIESADGHHKVKLSNVDRSLTWGKLTKRWGDWSEPTVEAALYEPRVVDPEVAMGWVKHDENVEALHDAVQARIDRLKAERKMLADLTRQEHRARRANLKELKGDPPDLVRVRQALDTLWRRRVARLKQEYRDRIAALRELRAELDEADRTDDIELDDIVGLDRSISIDWSVRSAQEGSPPGFEAVPVGQSIQYWRHESDTCAPAFVERGERIWVNDVSDASVRAALIVARARYGVVAAHGDKAFLAQARRLGREIGIEVQDGACIAAPPPRARSPRVGQRREAVGKWEARNPRPCAPAKIDIADAQLLDARATPIDSSVDRAACERVTIWRRVARLLAADDWDPRDYGQTAAGQGHRGRDALPERSDRRRSRSASLHDRHDAGNAR